MRIFSPIKKANKLMFISFFCLICFASFGQQEFTISGEVIDNKSKEPLPYAYVIFVGKSLGTTTDLSGQFQLYLSEASEADRVKILYVGYEPLIMTVAEACGEETFKLQPKVEKIKEVRVNGKRFKLRPFMREVIERYNEERRTTPHIAYGHYREKAKLNGKYVMFMEGLGYSVFLGENPNCTYLSNYKFYNEDMRCCNTDPQWKKCYSERNVTYEGEEIPPNNSFGTLRSFRCLEHDDVLSPKLSFRYSFDKDSTYYLNGEPVFVVKYGFMGDKGTIHVFAENMHLLSIEKEKKSKHKKGKVARWKEKFYFNYYGDTPFLAKAENIHFSENYEYTNELDILIQKLDEFNVSWREYWDMNTYCRNPFINYTPEKWKNYHIQPDADYAQIKADLSQSGIAVEEQYNNAARKWYYPDSPTNKPYVAIDKIIELKKLF
ncbi:carboxypeptidase-like regulatory domain-containing protein [Puteibacter caeruleilacunae]|nr:carboxypeptidase-like regulatory domain-containing protein [Puteibacter caeruleilacunae]